MFEVSADNNRNLLIIRIYGDFNNQQGQDLLQQLKAQITVLLPGFKLLTDLSGIEKIELDSYKSIDLMMELCNQYGVSKVIRVVTRESCDIGFNIMSLFHYSHSVYIHTCRSVREAEDYLKV